MEGDHFVFAHVSERGHVRQIRTELAAVADRDVDRRPLAASSRCRASAFGLDLREQRVVISPQRIEVHRHRSEGRYDVADTGNRGLLKCIGESDHARVDRRIDALLQFDDDRGVAGRNDTKRAHLVLPGSSAFSSFWWMPPNPPFDMTTTRSPARCSAATAATMASIDSASRADPPFAFTSRTS